jgi:hypothetical protein
MSPETALLDDLTHTAGRLAKVYGALAEQAEDRREGLAWFERFDRAFFAFRVGLALKMRLASMARAAARDVARPERVETERPETERLGESPEAAERLEYTERDRDRDTERASFPLLIKTLAGVVADAETLPGPQPVELLTLKDLLAKVGGAPAAPAVPLKARLAGSAAPAVTVLERPRPASRLGVPPRRATGPPRR